MWPRISLLWSSIAPKTNGSGLPRTTSTAPHSSTTTPTAAGTANSQASWLPHVRNGDQTERGSERRQAELEADSEAAASGRTSVHGRNPRKGVSHAGERRARAGA